MIELSTRESKLIGYGCKVGHHVLSVLRQEARNFHLLMCNGHSHEGTMFYGCLRTQSHYKHFILKENIPADSQKQGGTNYLRGIRGPVSALSYSRTQDKGCQVTMKAEVESLLTKLKLS